MKFLFAACVLSVACATIPARPAGSTFPADTPKALAEAFREDLAPQPSHVEGLWIARNSRWGATYVTWFPSDQYRGVFQSASAGPFGIDFHGAPLARGVDAEVLALSVVPQPGAPMHLTATDVRPVGVNAAATLDAALAAWQRYLADADADLARALDDAGAHTPGRPLGDERTDHDDRFRASWLPAEHRFTVLYQRIVVRSSRSSTYDPGRPSSCGKYRTPCMRPVEPHRVDTIRRYSATIAYAIELTADGKVAAERRYAARAHPSPQLDQETD